MLLIGYWEAVGSFTTKIIPATALEMAGGRKEQGGTSSSAVQALELLAESKTLSPPLHRSCCSSKHKQAYLCQRLADHYRLISCPKADEQRSLGAAAVCFPQNYMRTPHHAATVRYCAGRLRMAHTINKPPNALQLLPSPHHKPSCQQIRCSKTHYMETHMDSPGWMMTDVMFLSASSMDKVATNMLRAALDALHKKQPEWQS